MNKKSLRLKALKEIFYNRLLLLKDINLESFTHKIIQTFPNKKLLFLLIQEGIRHNNINFVSYCFNKNLIRAFKRRERIKLIKALLKSKSIELLTFVHLNQALSSPFPKKLVKKAAKTEAKLKCK